MDYKPLFSSMEDINLLTSAHDDYPVPYSFIETTKPGHYLPPVIKILSHISFQTFRYAGEKRPGKKYQNKEFMTLQLNNLQGKEVLVRIICVDADKKDKEHIHPNGLVGKDCHKGIYERRHKIMDSEQICQIKIPYIRIEQVKVNNSRSEKVKVRENLKVRVSCLPPPWRDQFISQCDELFCSAKIDTTKVRLAVIVTVEDSPGWLEKPLVDVSYTIKKGSEKTSLGIYKISCTAIPAMTGASMDIFLTEDSPPIEAGEYLIYVTYTSENQNEKLEHWMSKDFWPNAGCTLYKKVISYQVPPFDPDLSLATAIQARLHLVCPDSNLHCTFPFHYVPQDVANVHMQKQCGLWIDSDMDSAPCNKKLRAAGSDNNEITDALKASVRIKGNIFQGDVLQLTEESGAEDYQELTDTIDLRQKSRYLHSRFGEIYNTANTKTFSNTSDGKSNTSCLASSVGYCQNDLIPFEKNGAGNSLPLSRVNKVDNQHGSLAFENEAADFSKVNLRNQQHDFLLCESGTNMDDNQCDFLILENKQGDITLGESEINRVNTQQNCLLFDNKKDFSLAQSGINRETNQPGFLPYQNKKSDIGIAQSGINNETSQPGFFHYENKKTDFGLAQGIINRGTNQPGFLCDENKKTDFGLAQGIINRGTNQPGFLCDENKETDFGLAQSGINSGTNQLGFISFNSKKTVFGLTQSGIYSGTDQPGFLSDENKKTDLGLAQSGINSGTSQFGCLPYNNKKIDFGFAHTGMNNGDNHYGVHNCEPNQKDMNFTQSDWGGHQHKSFEKHGTDINIVQRGINIRSDQIGCLHFKNNRDKQEFLPFKKKKTESVQCGMNREDKMSVTTANFQQAAFNELDSVPPKCTVPFCTNVPQDVFSSKSFQYSQNNSPIRHTGDSVTSDNMTGSEDSSLSFDLINWIDETHGDEQVISSPFDTQLNNLNQPLPVNAAEHQTMQEENADDFSTLHLDSAEVFEHLFSSSSLDENKMLEAIQELENWIANNSLK